MKPRTTPNRDRSIRLLAASMPKVHRRDGETLRINLQGQIVAAGARERGISLLPIEAALMANRSASHVEVTINSIGGTVHIAEKIAAALGRHPGYKTVIADRVCASAATLILMAGDFRQATKGTVLLFHATEVVPPKGERWTAARHSAHAAMLSRLDQRIVEIYAKRTGRDSAIFAKEIRNEKSMPLNRAMDLGVIDCLDGEERWINGRPHAWPRGYGVANPIESRRDELTRIRKFARGNLSAFGGIIMGHVAFSKEADRLLGEGIR